MSSHVEQLRQLLARDTSGARQLLSVPGCWDGLSALLIEQAGFSAAFISGGAVSMARLGRPDLGIVSLTEAAETIAIVRDRIDLPLIADGDTGFGNTLTLQRAVHRFERAGAAAITIEDQVFPKRCGHMAGKRVVGRLEAMGRLKAALDARERMLIVARTDALAIEGFSSALDRAQAFVECGADLVFIEGPRTQEELEQIAATFSLRVPLVHNLVQGGTTPTDREDVLEALGFSVALHPLLLLGGFARHAPRWLTTLAKERSIPAKRDVAILEELNAMVGTAALIEQGTRYDGAD